MQQNVIKTVKENSLLDNISKTVDFYVIEQLDTKTTSLYRSIIPEDKSMELQKIDITLLNNLIILGTEDSVELKLVYGNNFRCVLADPISIMRRENDDSDDWYIKIMIGKCISRYDLNIWIFMKYVDFMKGPYKSLIKNHKEIFDNEFMLQKYKIKSLNAWLMHNKKIELLEVAKLAIKNNNGFRK